MLTSEPYPSEPAQVPTPRVVRPDWRDRMADGAVLLSGSLVAVSLGLLTFVLGAVAMALTHQAPMHVVEDVEPFLGPAYVDSFTVTCATTATLIQPTGGAQIAYSCQLPAAAETGGTTLVAVGDSAIADPAFATRNSPVYSGDTIREFNAHARLEYCRADTGTVTAFCRALVSVSTAP
jgi:hypothetical protein